MSKPAATHSTSRPVRLAAAESGCRLRGRCDRARRLDNRIARAVSQALKEVKVRKRQTQPDRPIHEAIIWADQSSERHAEQVGLGGSGRAPGSRLNAFLWRLIDRDRKLMNPGEPGCLQLSVWWLVPGGTDLIELHLIEENMKRDVVSNEQALESIRVEGPGG